MDSYARQLSQQNDRPEGLIYDNAETRTRIWIKTWAQLIHGCRGRLQMFQDNLQYTADSASALSYLHKTHEKYLPDCILNQHHVLISDQGEENSE